MGGDYSGLEGFSGAGSFEIVGGSKKKGQSVPSSGVGAPPLTTWNPSDKDAAAVLTNNNLTFTGGGATGVRSTNPLSAGDAYWEVLVNQDAGEVGGAYNVGFVDLATTFAQMRSSGIINMVFLFNGNIGNSIGPITLGAIVNGDTICQAVKFASKLSWFRKNNGLWNASALADPVTGVGGIPFITAGPYYANAASSAVGTQLIANFGGSAFTYTKPSNFTSWNGLVR